MTTIRKGAFVAGLAAILFAAAVSPVRQAAAQALLGGDLPATVTVGDRPLSASDHRSAFTRGDTLYVSGPDLMRTVSGAMSHDGNQYTVTSFPGMSSQKTAVFTVGSRTAIVNGTVVRLTAPPIEAYGHLFIPVSFFGNSAVRTKVTIARDNRSAVVTLPASMR